MIKLKRAVRENLLALIINLYIITYHWKRFTTKTTAPTKSRLVRNLVI